MSLPGGYSEKRVDENVQRRAALLISTRRRKVFQFISWINPALSLDIQIQCASCESLQRGKRRSFSILRILSLDNVSYAVKESESTWKISLSMLYRYEQWPLRSLVGAWSFHIWVGYIMEYKGLKWFSPATLSRCSTDKFAVFWAKTCASVLDAHFSVASVWCLCL